jgi:hypothetical protein
VIWTTCLYLVLRFRMCILHPNPPHTLVACCLNTEVTFTFMKEIKHFPKKECYWTEIRQYFSLLNIVVMRFYYYCCCCCCCYSIMFLNKPLFLHPASIFTSVTRIKLHLFSNFCFIHWKPFVAYMEHSQQHLYLILKNQLYISSCMW